LAVGSFIEEYNNQVQIIQLNDMGEFKPIGEIVHPYPTTKIMFMPDPTDIYPDLIATTGDYLRLWKIPDEKGNPTLECVLNNNKSSEFCAPLTSFDWNEFDPTVVGTSSIDTTCTLWDLNTGQAKDKTAARDAPVIKTSGEVKTQLIAHDQEVYDIAFQPSSRDNFASVGADGSVRMFDLKSLDHSNIIYEDQSSTPLLRIAWNKQNNQQMAIIKMDSREVIILDIRQSLTPVETLKGHTASVNGVSWSPLSAYHLCTAADDYKALIWDKQFEKQGGTAGEPILSYEAKGAINQIHWSSVQSDWIGIAYDRTLEILRV
jgi:WD repeat-containing protein 68